MTARKKLVRLRRQRRGATLVLAAILMVILFAFVAFAVDVGYMTLVRTQLQTAADASALAGAASMADTRANMEAAAQHMAAQQAVGGSGRTISLKSSEIEYGTWDESTRAFAPSASVGNAVRVTARADDTQNGKTPLFFGRLLGTSSFAAQAQAVATANPRDIVFIFDLSGSMNDDTDPDNTANLNALFAPQGFPTVGTDLMQVVYNDFGYGAYPGTSEWAGKSIGVSGSSSTPLTDLQSKTGPLSNSGIPTKYKIKSSDSASTRKTKAYSWLMDVQIKTLMPNAKPVPNSTTNYNYWAKYIESYTSSGKDIGYKSYVHFMMAYGGEGKPDGVNYTPLSVDSPECPWHSESTAGGTFNFPPCEQPTHSCRRAAIAGLQVVKQRNNTIANTLYRDWVSIVAFSGTDAWVVQPLTSDYDDAMLACTKLQAISAGTGTDAGMINAQNQIKSQKDGGPGRNYANKVVVVLTDGVPNDSVSSSSDISAQRAASKYQSQYYGSNDDKDAPLMIADQMRLKNWQVFAVGVGLGADYDFLDRLASLGGTAKNGQAPRTPGNPLQYEQKVTEIFNAIITSAKIRLVQ